MVLRSQLDAVHEHLPGNGTFDLKTRGTVAIRQDRLNYEVSEFRGSIIRANATHLSIVFHHRNQLVIRSID